MKTPTLVRCRDGLYRVRGTVDANELAKMAAEALQERVLPIEKITEPRKAGQFLQLMLAHEKQEHFAALFLNSQHGVLRFEKLFTGTIDAVTVYPRIVVERALAINAAAVIFAHNHPSGSTEPSGADKSMTRRLKEVLSLVDTRVLDHFIVTPHHVTSMAELGLI